MFQWQLLLHFLFVGRHSILKDWWHCISQIGVALSYRQYNVTFFIYQVNIAKFCKLLVVGWSFSLCARFPPPRYNRLLVKSKNCRWTRTIQPTLYGATLCDNVCQWLAASRWFSPGNPVSPTNKTDRHNITEILVKVALNAINQTKPKYISKYSALNDFSGD